MLPLRGTTLSLNREDGRRVVLNPGDSGSECTFVLGPAVWYRAATADTLQPLTFSSSAAATLQVVAVDSNASWLALTDTSKTIRQILTLKVNTSFLFAWTTVSADAWGQVGNASSSAAVMSADGRKIAFSSRASNLVGDEPAMAFDHLYVRDVNIPHLSSVSPASARRCRAGPARRLGLPGLVERALPRLLHGDVGRHGTEALSASPVDGP